MTTLIENVIAAARTAKGRPTASDKATWPAYRAVVARLAAGEPLTDAQSATLASCLADYGLNDSALAADVTAWQRTPALEKSARASAEKIERLAIEAQEARELFEASQGLIAEGARISFEAQATAAALKKAEVHAGQTEVALRSHLRHNQRLFGDLQDGTAQ